MVLERRRPVQYHGQLSSGWHWVSCIAGGLESGARSCLMGNSSAMRAISSRAISNVSSMKGNSSVSQWLSLGAESSGTGLDGTLSGARVNGTTLGSMELEWPGAGCTPLEPYVFLVSA